jgi:hypothetical protein
MKPKGEGKAIKRADDVSETEMGWEKNRADNMLETETGKVRKQGDHLIPRREGIAT